MIYNYNQLILMSIVHDIVFIQYQKQTQLNKIKMGENDDKIQPHILQRYQVIKKIGCGAYGVVWKVLDRRQKTFFALKKNFDAFQNSTDAQRTYRQIMFLTSCSHPNIISLSSLLPSHTQRDIYLLFQFMDIDLYTLIRENILQQKHKRYIIYQVAKAILYLHSGEVIHRDIKPSNILVNQNCGVKMCDFGLVRSVGEESQQDANAVLTEYIATRWYRAPEILLGSKKYAKAVDVWSFGCLLGEIIKGKPLFPGNSTLNQIQRVLTWTGAPTLSDLKSLKTDFGKQMLQLLSKIKKQPKSQWFPNISNSAYDLLSKTLQFNPQKRLTMNEVLKHPYLREFYNQEEIITADSRIRVPIDDNRKLSLKEYRQLIYKFMKEHYDEENGKEEEGKERFVQSLKSSIVPGKSVIGSKKTSNSTGKQVKQGKQHLNATNLLRESANRTIHKSRLYKGPSFTQTSTQKPKIHSLGASNKSIHKKPQSSLKPPLYQLQPPKKYQSLLNKKIVSMSKTKHIRTEGESQKDEAGFGQGKFKEVTSEGKKNVRDRRGSEGLAKYMYKHKYY